MPIRVLARDYNGAILWGRVYWFPIVHRILPISETATELGAACGYPLSAQGIPARSSIGPTIQSVAASFQATAYS